LSLVSWHLLSQGSVATRLRCGGIFSHYFIARLPLSQMVKNLNIGQHLAKLWARAGCHVFDGTHSRRWCGSAVTQPDWLNAKTVTVESTLAYSRLKNLQHCLHSIQFKYPPCCHSYCTAMRSPVAWPRVLWLVTGRSGRAFRLLVVQRPSLDSDI